MNLKEKLEMINAEKKEQFISIQNELNEKYSKYISLEDFCKSISGKVKEYCLQWCSKQDNTKKWVQDLISIFTDADIAHTLVNCLSFGLSQKEGCSLKVFSAFVRTNKAIKYEHSSTRMANYCQCILNALLHFGFISIEAKGYKYTQTTSQNSVDGGGLVRVNLPDSWDEGKKILPLRCGSSYYTKGVTHTLGSIFNPDGNEVEHCQETIDLVNSVPLQFNSNLFEYNGRQIGLSEMRADKFNPEKHESLEDYQAQRELQHSQYQGRFGEYIPNIPVNKNKCFYNVSLPGGEGRMYVDNDIGNFTGIKGIRFMVQFGNGEYVGKDY